MKEKQLRSIQNTHKSYLNLGAQKRPDIQPHINIALVSGEAVKMRSASEIVKLARTKIASGHYGRTLEFHDVFSSCNGYEEDVKQWESREKKRLALVAKYRKIADPLVRKAELNDEADPEEIAAKLVEAAQETGLVTGVQALPTSEPIALQDE